MKKCEAERRRSGGGRGSDRGRERGGSGGREEGMRLERGGDVERSGEVGERVVWKWGGGGGGGRRGERDGEIEERLRGRGNEGQNWGG